MKKSRILLLAVLIILFYYSIQKDVNFQYGNTVTQKEETASPTANQTPTVKENATVERVIDGDTIKLLDGRTVRYIGIDTPEIKDPNKPKECLGEEAYFRNKELVEEKEIVLEKDVSEKDRFGRILRYVWVGDELINEILVKEGLAFASRYPPDIKYQDKLESAQKNAQTNFLGLWSGVCHDL